jgi:hypothetical protein
VTSQFTAVRGSFALGPAWLAVPLFVVGLVTIFRLGRPATAIMLAVLWPEMLALSALHRYPFLDRRTSTFLFAITVVVAAIGVAGVCSLLRPWLRGAVAATAVAAFAIAAWPSVRSHTLPVEDVRDQARYVAAHAAPADVIVVNLSSNWGFAYYWPVGQPARREDDAVVQDYEAYYPGQPRIVVARTRDRAGVDSVLSQALSQARARPGACSRIWLIRSHMSAPELAAWGAGLRQYGLSPRPVGDDGLSVVPAAGSPCR